MVKRKSATFEFSELNPMGGKVVVMLDVDYEAKKFSVRPYDGNSFIFPKHGSARSEIWLLVAGLIAEAVKFGRKELDCPAICEPEKDCHAYNTPQP